MRVHARVFAAIRPVRSRKNAHAHVCVHSFFGAFTLCTSFALRICARVIFELVELLFLDHVRQYRCAAVAVLRVHGCVRCCHVRSRCFCVARAACCFRSIGTQLGELARVRWLGCFVRARTRSSRSSRRRCLRLGGCCSFPPWIRAPHFHEAGPRAGGGEESERRNGRSRERTGADESGRAQIRAAELGPERTRENEGGLHERDATTRAREVR